MDFQPGMTLIVAAISGGIGAVSSYAVTKTKVDNLMENIKEMKTTVVYKDTCVQCQSRWTGRMGDLKDNIERIDGKIDRILERLK